MKDQSRIISVLSALIMIVGGGVLAATDGTISSTCGTVSVAVGSMLMTISISDIRNLEKAKMILAPHLEPVCDQFLDAISQLRQATKDFRDGSITDETAGELIAAHASSMESALRNLHAYSGATSDRSRIEKSKRDTQLGRIDMEARAPSNTVASRTSSLEDGPRGENVACPNCRTHREVSLGVNVGDSAIAECDNCHLRFHVHRDRYGDPFTKPWGSGSGRQFDFWCPSCGQFHFKFKVTSELYPRYCTKCGACIMPNDEGGEVVRKAVSPLSGTVVPNLIEDGRGVLDCSCGQRCTSFYKDEEALFAVCRRCDLLVRAPVAPRVEVDEIQAS